MFPKAIRHFIDENLHRPLAEVSLKLSKKKDWPKEEILNQINGKQKVIKKFPFLKSVPEYKFPSPRAFSQASSEITAGYKASIVKAKKVADLSGGMGIDSYFFSKAAARVDYVEANGMLYRQTVENFKTLGAENIKTHKCTAEDFIAKAGQFDLIYIDPDRRNKNKRLFLLEDCQPNVIELLPSLFEKTDKILLKLSPLLDLKSVLRQLPHLETIWVLAVKNDCKELLIQLNKTLDQQPKINCCNLLKPGQQFFSFDYENEQSAVVDYAAPLKYLYEPNVCINKAGAFKSIAEKFQLHKLATNTHLYTSNRHVKDFPGRILKIIKMEKPQKQKGKKANVVSKNFPLKAAEIRKKYQISEAVDAFIYACRLQEDEKVFIHAVRSNHLP